MSFAGRADKRDHSPRALTAAAENGASGTATLHTRGAAQAVERLVDSFPAQEKNRYAAAQSGGSLRAVLSQKLRRQAGGAWRCR